MFIEEGSKLVMIGDSVTDCGRQRPVGEGNSEGIGWGYVGFTSGLLSSIYPEKRIRVMNLGISGNTVLDLKERWQSDVVDLKPDWLSIMIGINDVWRHFDGPLRSEGHVSLQQYRETLEELVVSTLPKVNGIVLMTPYFMEANKEDPMRKAMDQYGQAVKAIAEKYATYFVDTQEAFDAYFKHYHTYTLAGDRIHPNIAGHMILAKGFLNAVGFDWNHKA